MKLHGVKWTKGKPSVVSVNAVRHGDFWLLSPPEDDTWANGQPFQHRFGVRNTIMESNREKYSIGTDPVEAVYLTLQTLKEEESALEALLLEVRRKLTEIAVLGMAEAKVIL